MHPNPAINFLQISGLIETQDYKIYNSLGKEVKNGSISNQEKINIQNLTKGIYFLNFANGSTFKFLKE
ncbi:T9SS type A sorting domain-containing protein [Winogradskyella rapida]|uniref:T9SS type A sorting domain-containing protein n=1 Tax=Winogradskyella rapida TaxID=549701 RepID=A0ABW3KLA3_9FLAO